MPIGGQLCRKRKVEKDVFIDGAPLRLPLRYYGNKLTFLNETVVQYTGVH